MEYEVTLLVQIPKKLTAEQCEDLSNAILEALDQAKLPFKADVVTGGVNGPL
jgi:hypothetical protein